MRRSKPFPSKSRRGESTGAKDRGALASHHSPSLVSIRNTSDVRRDHSDVLAKLSEAYEAGRRAERSEGSQEERELSDRFGWSSASVSNKTSRDHVAEDGGVRVEGVRQEATSAKRGEEGK